MPSHRPYVLHRFLTTETSTAIYSHLQPHKIPQVKCILPLHAHPTIFFGVGRARWLEACFSPKAHTRPPGFEISFASATSATNLTQTKLIPPGPIVCAKCRSGFGIQALDSDSEAWAWTWDLDASCLDKRNTTTPGRNLQPTDTPSQWKSYSWQRCKAEAKQPQPGLHTDPIVQPALGYPGLVLLIQVSCAASNRSARFDFFCCRSGVGLQLNVSSACPKWQCPCSRCKPCCSSSVLKISGCFWQSFQQNVLSDLKRQLWTLKELLQAVHLQTPARWPQCFVQLRSFLPKKSEAQENPAPQRPPAEFSTVNSNLPDNNGKYHVKANNLQTLISLTSNHSNPQFFCWWTQLMSTVHFSKFSFQHCHKRIKNGQEPSMIRSIVWQYRHHPYLQWWDQVSTARLTWLKAVMSWILDTR